MVGGLPVKPAVQAVDILAVVAADAAECARLICSVLVTRCADAVQAGLAGQALTEVFASTCVNRYGCETACGT